MRDRSETISIPVAARAGVDPESLKPLCAMSDAPPIPPLASEDEFLLCGGSILAPIPGDGSDSLPVVLIPYSVGRRENPVMGD